MIESGNRPATIRVHALEKSFSARPVLKNIDFTADPGEIISICGPNGAGKTTFLRLLATLSRPGAGEILLAGMPLPKMAAEVRNRIGVVFHHPMLYGEMSALENLDFYAKIYGGPFSTRQILEEVGLSSRRDDLVRTFSRGMQQRLAIGRAILHDPQFLILDEPFSGLDQEGCQIFGRILRDFAAGGKTVVLASHDLSQAAAISARIDVFHRGRIVLSLPRGACTADELPAVYAAAVHPARQPQ